jgi:hypothetical protein
MITPDDFAKDVPRVLFAVPRPPAADGAVCSLQCQLIDLNSSDIKLDEGIKYANSVEEEVDIIKLRAITMEQVDAWNKSKGCNRLIGKGSAGYSMTESPNDQGYMHNILHKLFATRNFKYQQHSGLPWR